MAVQQETLIGDDDLDALMAELETETAGMVAAPVIKATASIAAVEDAVNALEGLDMDASLTQVAVVEKQLSEALGQEVRIETVDEDDPLADLDDPQGSSPPWIEADKLKSALSKSAQVEEVVPASSKDDNIDDEMAALEAELNAAVVPATTPPPAAVSAAPSMAEKIAAKAAAAAGAYPSDVPKTIQVKEGDAFIAPPGTVVEHVAANKNLDEELAAIAAAMPAATESPKNPNPPPTAPVPGVTAKGALAGLGFEIDIDQFRRDISVTETNLDNCMMEQAGLIAWYIAQHAGAEAQAARTKVQVEMGEAKLYAQHRAALSATTEKVTEKLVENAVRMDPKYGAIQNRLIETETRAAVWKGCVEGLKQRRDMIIQLGADRREDGKGAVRIMAKEQSHADLKAAAVAAARRN